MACLLSYTVTTHHRTARANTSTAGSPSAKSLPFPSESRLVKDFLKINNTGSRQDILSCTELNTGNGIADIVFLKKRKNWLEQEFFFEIKPQWAHAIVALPYRKTFDTSHLATIACTSTKTANKLLRECVSSGICVKSKNGWIKVKQPRPPFSQIFAIEAKLKDWRRALFQASRYLEFAHQSWVLLDTHYSKAALENIHEFERRNIGILTLNKAGELVAPVRPHSQQPRSDFRYWHAMLGALNSK